MSNLLRSSLRRGPLAVLALEDRIVPAASLGDNSTLTALPPATGGAMVAAGDITGDGFADVVTGPSVGGPPLVRAYDGRTGAVVWQFLAYSAGFTGGVSVAVADVTGDGRADIVTGTGYGGGPNVKVFDGATRQEARSFFAFAPGFTGGTRVAAGDVTGDGRADIAVAAGYGGGPVVAVFDGVTGGWVTNIAAGDPTAAVGATVAVADLTGDGKAELIVGSGGGTPTVRVFDLTTGTNPVAEFHPYDPAFTGPVWVAAGDVTGDGTPDIVTAAGVTGAPNVRVFDGRTRSEIRSWMAYDPTFQGGAFVATADVNGDGRTDVVTGAGPCGGPHVRVFDAVDLGVLGSFTAANPPGSPASAFARDDSPPVVTLLTPPNPLVTAPPAIVGRVTDVGSGVARLQASVDGGAFADTVFQPDGSFAYTPPATVPDGARTVAFRAYDRAGNESKVVTFPYTLDRTPPVVAITTANNPLLNAPPAVAGTVADTVSGVARLQASVYGGAFADVAFQSDGSFSFTPTGATEGANTVTFRATDRAGNVSPDTPFPFVLDTIPPVVILTTPPNPLVNAAPVVAGKVTDVGTGVARLQASVNGGTFADVAFASDGSFTVTPLGSSQGANAVAFRAFDRAGNQSASVGFPYTFDSVPPVVTINSAQNQVVNAAPTIAGTVTDAVSGVARLQASVNGGAFADVTVGSGGAFTLTLAGSTQGINSVLFRAFDAAGNQSANQTFTYTFDTIPPVVNISTAQNQLVSAAPAIAGTVTDIGSGVARLQASVNGGTFIDVAFAAGGAFSFTPTGTVEGANTVVFRAFDLAGNQSANQSFSFTLDTIPPTVTSFSLTTTPPNTSLPVSPTNPMHYTVTFSEPVNAAAFDVTNYTLTPNVSAPGSLLTATQLSATSVVVTFWAPGVNNTIVRYDFEILDNRVRDLAGNLLAGNRSTQYFVDNSIK